MRFAVYSKALFYAPLEGLGGEDFLNERYRDRIGCYALSDTQSSKMRWEHQKVNRENKSHPTKSLDKKATPLWLQ